MVKSNLSPRLLGRYVTYHFKSQSKKINVGLIPSEITTKVPLENNEGEIY